MGQVALGVIAIGQVAVGIVALGQIAVGVAGALAQIAFATHALGQVACGERSLGQFSCSMTLGLPVESGAWIVAAAWLLVAYGREQKRLKRILRTPLRLIAHARPGLVVIQGRVVALDTLEAPVSKRACVGYDVRPRACKVLGLAPDAPASGCAWTDFLVEDVSGYARVLVAGLVPVFEPAVRGAGTAERVLLPGEWVTVTGTALTSLDGGTMTGTRTRQRLVVVSGQEGPVFVSQRRTEELRAQVEGVLWLAGTLAVRAVVALLLR